ncbi:MAG: LytTR family DNA-binding domain-containing protein [Bacteroidota bacterium]
MLTAIAIDDEPIALEIIKKHAANIAFIDIRKTFTNAFEATTWMQKEKVDLIFLDIKMPDISGIDFLNALQNPPLVIFTTAYSEHAVQGFELNAVDYLLKPFSAARFLKACNKANELYQLKAGNSDSSVFIKSGYGQVQVVLSEILYIESSGNYVQFVLENKKVVSRLTMSEAEVLLPAKDFIRIHRSYMVAKKKIARFEKNIIWIGLTELPVGTNYQQQVEKLFQKE